MEIFGSGMGKSRIRDKHPGSATLFFSYFAMHGTSFYEEIIIEIFARSRW
jgi:hypothetical protein